MQIHPKVHHWPKKELAGKRLLVEFRVSRVAQAKVLTTAGWN